jgi:adenylate cyclase
LLCLLPGLAALLAFARLRWAHAALLALGVALCWIGLSALLFVTQGYALPAGLPLAGLLLTSASMGGYRALGEERERQQVLGLWGRYQDARLVEYLLEHPNARGGQGHEVEVTVLFADLKNFTKTVEHLSPGETIQVLNRYLSLMTDVIRDEFGGVVDKYLGDGLMAQWGAPRLWEGEETEDIYALTGHHHTDHAATAVAACLELQRRTRELTRSIAGDRDVTFGLRLVLHSGPVMIGWVGAERIEFTIIGDTVNVCARLQETAKQLKSDFLVSETTYESVEGWVRVGQQAEVEIRGRDQPLRVYEVCDETIRAGTSE